MTCKECPWCDWEIDGVREQDAKLARVQHMFAKHDDERKIVWYEQLQQYDEEGEL